MARPYVPDPAEFLTALEEHGDAFGVADFPSGIAVADVRRRRGRLADESETGYRDVSLVQRDGVLMWVLSSELVGEVSGGGRRRRRRRAAGPARSGVEVLKEVCVPVLEPNEYLAALARTDEQLNPDEGVGLRVVKADGNGGFVLTTDDLKQTYTGRTLILVHGTFSSSRHLLDEYAATEAGRRFLMDAIKAYKGQVLAFDHPTLSVSPFLNAVDLARRLAGCRGMLDVVAHSRGGVVVRWWLDVLGGGLADAEVRAVLVGSPLKGTSLAAPNRIEPLLSVLSNIGSFVSRTLGIAASANPFTLASFALLKFIVRREKEQWGVPPVADIGRRPDIDAAVAVIPGLQGQSAVVNNYELKRLWDCPRRVKVDYYAITADFEPERMGWKLWKVITEFQTRAGDAVADRVFPKENDLVVDTAHMTYLDERTSIGKVHAFGQQASVHHCNYFRQLQTLTRMRQWLDVR